MLIGVRQWCCWSRCDLLWEKQGPARIGGDKGVADVKVNGLEFVTGETEKTGNSNDAAGRGEVKRAKKLFLCLKTTRSFWTKIIVISDVLEISVCSRWPLLVTIGHYGQHGQHCGDV